MRKKLTISILDQAVISAFNFGLTLYLIRLWSPDDFGVFALITAASIFVAMLQNALVNTPLAVHLPLAHLEADKDVLRRVFSAANIVLSLLVLLVSGGGLLAWLGASHMALVLGASLYMATQCVREYCRGLLAVEGKLGALLLVDLAYVIVSIACLGYLHWRGDALLQTVSTFLWVLSGAGFLTILRHLVPRSMPALRALPKEMVGVFRPQMHEIRWSLLGVITTDVQNRGYIFIAAAVFGPAAVAHLQAGRIFFGPLNLITGSWARIARPQLAGMIGKGEIEKFHATLHRALWAFFAFNILFLVFLWVAWPHLSTLVFGNKYQGLGTMIAAWGVANIAFQIRSCLSIGVQALRRFRDLTLATIYGAVVSVALVAVACYVHQQEWLIASVIGGECIAIFVVVNILRRHVPKI